MSKSHFEQWYKLRVQSFKVVSEIGRVSDLKNYQK